MRDAPRWAADAGRARAADDFDALALIMYNTTLDYHFGQMMIDAAADTAVIARYDYRHAHSGAPPRPMSRRKPPA